MLLLNNGSGIGIVAFGFVSSPSAVSDRVIGEQVAERSRGQIPIFTQVGVPLPIEHEITRIDEGMTAEIRPPTTLHISRGAVEWALRRDFSRLIIVAATPHMWRACRDLKFVIDEQNADIDVDVHVMPYVEHRLWFTKDSRWWWTRSAHQWFVYDTLIRMMPMFLYKHIAK